MYVQYTFLLGVEEDVEVDKNVNNRNVEPDWECTCKARFLLKNSKKRIDIRRLKHQGHCQELVKIRERFAERKKVWSNSLHFSYFVNDNNFFDFTSFFCLFYMT